MTFNHARRAQERLLARKWYFVIGVVVLAVAGCNPPMPDNSPQATGDPVTAAEVEGHWFKMVAQGEPQIDVRPVVVEGVINALADELLAQIPDLTEDYPLYIYVTNALAAGAAADATTGTYVGFELPVSERIEPVEQPDGSLLFQGPDLLSFLQEVVPGGGSGNFWENHNGGFEIDGLPVSELTAKLWLYRLEGYEQIQFRVSAEAAIEVPMVGLVEVQVTLDGTARLSEGPEADGYVSDGWVDPTDWDE